MLHTDLKWPGFTAYSTLIITVDKDEFGIEPEPIEYSGKTFNPKQEAHITVIGSELGSYLRQQFIHQPHIEKQIKLAFESTDWSYKKTHELRHLARDNAKPSDENKTEESIIMLIDMAGMAEFYTKLKTLGLINKDHPVPPPHVTLYTCNCDIGIGVHSESELSRLSYGRIDELV